MDPLVFEPYFRPQVWGQRRLERLLRRPLPSTEPFGEAWVISAHPHHVSRVAEGPHRGARLTELCTRYAPELFGGAAPATGEFPLLVKFLDCHAQLSIQVHPTDELARRLTHEPADALQSRKLPAMLPIPRILRPVSTTPRVTSPPDASLTSPSVSRWSVPEVIDLHPLVSRSDVL